VSCWASAAGARAADVQAQDGQRRHGLDGRTIRWEVFEEQKGDAEPTPFSFRRKKLSSRRSVATSPSPRRIRCASSAKMLHRSAMYSGADRGRGSALLPRRLKTKSSSSPTRRSTSFFWSRRGAHPRGLRERHVHLAAHGGAMGDCAHDSWVGGAEMCGPATPSNTTAWTRRNWTGRCA